MSWLKAFFGVGKIASEYLKNRQKLKQELTLARLRGKIALEDAKTKAAITQQEHVQTWEQMYVGMQADSLKDELVLGVLLLPYIGAFIPGVQDYVVTGFDYLGRMPYWAVGLTVTVMLAIYGIRHRNASKLQVPGLRDSDVSSTK